MCLHAKDAALGSIKSVNIVSYDSFWLKVWLCMMKSWITFGKDRDLQWIPIHSVFISLGPSSKALPFFHAFTGCDFVSAFVGKGKKTARQAWNVFENATEACH